MEIGKSSCEDCIYLKEITNGKSTCRTFELTTRGLVDVFLHERPAVGCKNKRTAKTGLKDTERVRKNTNFNFGRYRK